MRARLPIPCLLFLALAQGAFAAGPTPTPTDIPLNGNALLRAWVPPVYPPDALKQRVGGMAVIRMVVDEKGTVASAHVLDASDPRLGEAALAAARKWVFSPALDEGRPVAISMDAPVDFSPDTAARKPGFLPPADQTPQPSPKTPAKPNETYSADYPGSLLDRNLSGLVRFRCTIAPDGRALAVRVLLATHPDFVAPALRSLDRWTFTPGMQGDLPDQSDVEGDITFDATAKGPGDVLAANHITAPDGTPPATAPELRVAADPVWPYELVLKGEGGSADVTYTISGNGQPSDVQVQSATKPEYGKALVAAVEASYFVEAMDSGHAVAVALKQHAEFTAIPPDAKDDADPLARVLSAVRSNQVSSSQGLDEKLTPIYRVAPAYPGALRKAGRPAGGAVIDFVIDREGRARLPQIISATSEEFGWAAATAVAQWVFRPPLRGGQPVDVKVRIPFAFKSPPS
jgi:TonB family protein